MKAVDFAEKLKEKLRDGDFLYEQIKRTLVIHGEHNVALDKTTMLVVFDTINNTLKQKTKRYILEGFVRSYHSPRKEGDDHRTYRGMLHHLKKDKHLNTLSFLHRILADKVPEGNSVRIIVEDTGQRAEKADTRWVLLRPHHYGPETEAEDDKIVS